MCGIAGIFSMSPPDVTLLQRMAQSIAHRGPDDEGVWTHGPSGIGFAHRRLSIVDLSASGHQPMLSADGRFVLNFNGEIYNHRQLRSDLEEAGAVPNCGWRGHSDTETFLQAISTWGLDGAIGRAVGMFAIALWDSKTRILALARDRFGEKPLYYGWAGRDFVFGSELKALRLHPQFDNPISRRALQLFAARTHVPAPFSIYERIFKLPVGCILEVDRDACSAPLTDPPEENAGSKGLKLRCYWSYREVMRRGLADQIRDPSAALAELEKTLATAIVDQSIADVPVGAFLSGGIDSSTIVALYQKHSNVPVRTFTIAFEEGGYNEAEDAHRVAAHLGTVHHEQRVSAREASDVIPLLPNIYDEPFADSSQIPTFLVSRLARQEVKVALSGDGGDELFGGYARHFSAPAVWQQARRVPQAVRRFAGSALARVPVRVWAGVNELLPGRRQPHFGGKVQKAFRVLSRAQTIEDVYFSFLDEWCFEESPVRGVTPSVPIHVDASLAARMALLRTHGVTRDPSVLRSESPGAWYYEQHELGFNYRMTDIQAALGFSQLLRLDEFVQQRRRLASRYDEAFEGLPLTRPWQHSETNSSWHLYVIRVDPAIHADVFERLRHDGIGVNLHYIPIPRQPYYRALGFDPSGWPEAERYYSEAITLPLYPAMSDEQQDQVIAAVKEALGCA
jgi:asparagine synthase (glutamine-hydrolysing)